MAEISEGEYQESSREPDLKASEAFAEIQLLSPGYCYFWGGWLEQMLKKFKHEHTTDSFQVFARDLMNTLRPELVTWLAQTKGVDTDVAKIAAKWLEENL